MFLIYKMFAVLIKGVKFLAWRNIRSRPFDVLKVIAVLLSESFGVAVNDVIFQVGQKDKLLVAGDA